MVYWSSLDSTNQIINDLVLMKVLWSTDLDTDIWSIALSPQSVCRNWSLRMPLSWSLEWLRAALYISKNTGCWHCFLECLRWRCEVRRHSPWTLSCYNECSRWLLVMTACHSLVSERCGDIVVGHGWLTAAAGDDSEHLIAPHISPHADLL